jgi:hypothetical protein
MLFASSRARTLRLIFFLAILIIPQLAALGLQFALGFRPFRQDPVRVALSWDMFSNRVERCVLSWNPPLNTPGAPLTSLHEAGLSLEWDLILDRMGSYAMLGHGLCRQWGSPLTQVQMQCFLPAGTEAHYAMPCRD